MSPVAKVKQMPDWAKILIGGILAMVIPFAGAIYGYGELNSRVSNVENNLEATRRGQQTARELVDQLSRDMTMIQTDLAWIKEGIREIKTDIRTRGSATPVRPTP